MTKKILAEFPYQSDPNGNIFPIIPLSIAFADAKKEFYALIDSGATVSVFRAEVAEELGIEIGKGEETYLVSFNLLGRAAVFPKFKITFEEKKQQIILA